MGKVVCGEFGDVANTRERRCGWMATKTLQREWMARDGVSDAWGLAGPRRSTFFRLVLKLVVLSSKASQGSSQRYGNGTYCTVHDMTTSHARLNKATSLKHGDGNSEGSGRSVVRSRGIKKRRPNWGMGVCAYVCRCGSVERVPRSDAPKKQRGMHQGSRGILRHIPSFVSCSWSEGNGEFRPQKEIGVAHKLHVTTWHTQVTNRNVPT